MKRLFVVLLAFIMCFCSCAKDSGEETKKTKDNKTTESTSQTEAVTEEETTEDTQPKVEVTLTAREQFYYSSIYYAHSYSDMVDPSTEYVEVEGEDVLLHDFLVDHDFLVENTAYSIACADYYLQKCEREGVVLSSENKAEVDATISLMAERAEDSGLSLSEYLSETYGEEIDENVYEQLLYEQYLVTQYMSSIEEDIRDSITDAEIDKLKNSPEFQNVDMRLFGFSIEDYNSVTDAEDEAAEMCERITDEESFVSLALEYAPEDDKDIFKKDSATIAKAIKKDVVEEKIGEDLADWLYNDEREVGDKRTYTTDEYVYVIYITKTRYPNDKPLVDCRHILISFEEVAKELEKKEGNKIDTELDYDIDVETATEGDKEITNEGTGYSIELVTEAYKKAEDIYESFLTQGSTEEAFIELASKNSHDTTASNGGLIENIEMGTMVTPFENWIYEDGRNPGDVDIIMTEYGWHVMYFVKSHEEPAWKVDVRESLGSAKFEEISKADEAAMPKAEPTFFIDFAAKEALKTNKSR